MFDSRSVWPWIRSESFLSASFGFDGVHAKALRSRHVMPEGAVPNAVVLA